MRFKHLIVMITVMFLFLCGQLWAEEIVGISIFPNIETPQPYPQREEGQSLVWSTTIEEPGATWIKIHFSSFQLNVKDFVNLIDEQGRIVENIKFRDVNGKNASRFNLQKNDDHTVSFWTLAVDGQKIRIELHRESNKITGRGFTIDEIGIGSKPIFDRGPGPVYNDDEKTGASSLPFPEKNFLDFQLSQMMITPVESTGTMLYKKGATWYTCKGNLLIGGPNEFLPIENCIDSREVVDTLEVRFYFNCNCLKSDSPIYQSFYGDKFIENYFDFEHGLVRLKPDMKMIESYLKKRNPSYGSIMGECPKVWCPKCESWYQLCSTCGLCHCKCPGVCPCGCTD